MVIGSDVSEVYVMNKVDYIKSKLFIYSFLFVAWAMHGSSRMIEPPYVGF